MADGATEEGLAAAAGSGDQQVLPAFAINGVTINGVRVIDPPTSIGETSTTIGLTIPLT